MRIIALLLVALIAAASPAQPDIIKGPYLQHMLQDAVTIMWETDAPADSTVHYSVGGQWFSEQSGSNATR